MVMPVLLLVGEPGGAVRALHARQRARGPRLGVRDDGALEGPPRDGRVLCRHAFRNALIPIITVIGLTRCPTSWQAPSSPRRSSAGRAWASSPSRPRAGRDAALMMGVILVVATGVLITNLITDVVYAVADPRVRLGEPLPDARRSDAAGARRRLAARARSFRASAVSALPAPPAGDHRASSSLVVLLR